MKVVKSLTAKETLELISKQYATISDIQSIAGVGKDQARTIKKEIEKKMINDYGLNISNGKIPMDKLVEHLNINVSYLKELSNIWLIN